MATATDLLSKNAQLAPGWFRSSPGRLNDLLDVGGTPTNGQVLAYQASTTSWIPATDVAGATTLEDLTDTTITAVAKNHILKYDGFTWVNLQPEHIQLWSDVAAGATTISIAGTYYDVVVDAGTSSSASLFALTANDGEIKYNGPGGLFHIQYTVAVNRDAGAAMVTYCLATKINAATLGTGITKVTTDAAGTAESAHHQTLVTLNTNDLIKLQIAGVGHTDDAEITAYTFVITRVD